MLQPYVTPLPFALVVGVHLTCFAAFAILATRSGPQFQGWRIVGPSGTHWFCYVGSWSFSALISWVWLFVGSGRRDAEKQMFYAQLLIFAFGLAAAWTGAYIIHLRRVALRWRGEEIRWQQKGIEVVQKMSNFESFKRAFSGALHLRFRDGAIIKIDLHARNAEEFVVALSERTDVSFD